MPSLSRVLAFCASLLLALTTAACFRDVPQRYSVSSDCDSGVLQMKPLSPNQDCIEVPLTSNSIKAVCAAALLVSVKEGLVKIIPIEQGTYMYTAFDFESVYYKSKTPFNCKDANASGRVYPGSTTSASVMLYDDYGGPLSNLTRTGADRITLTTGRGCTFEYEVVQGCVFGIRAPARAAAACPAGYHRKVGRFNTGFCAPCGPGTYSSEPGAPCKPCPVGSASLVLGAAQCTTCGAGTPAEGAADCWDCMASDVWTDGTTCTACPKDSYPVAASSAPRCEKCVAGRRCCTVGWGQDCPKCTAGSVASSITSVFVLESAAPAACLATAHALCSPDIEAIVADTCDVYLGNPGGAMMDALDDLSSCAWAWQGRLHGTQVVLSDLPAFATPDHESSLLAGTFTSAASPYLQVYIPATNCTLRYRALTSPVAALLGAAPQPGDATTCAPGHYLETETDTPPGPCLPCPRGTFSSAPSSGRTCTQCPAGTFADRYGSTECKRCPAGTKSDPGAAWCRACTAMRWGTQEDSACLECPPGSTTIANWWHYQMPDMEPSRCLMNAYGSICCAAGSCEGQAPCHGAQPSPAAMCQLGHTACQDEGELETYTAVFQLVSKSLPQPSCSNAGLLSTLPVNGELLLTSTSGALSLAMAVYQGARGNGTQYDYHGGYFGTNSAWVRHSTMHKFQYGLTTATSLFPGHHPTGTVVVYLSTNISDLALTNLVNGLPAKPVVDCFATFRLLSGYAFDLEPPKGAACRPDEGVTTHSGRKFCKACEGTQVRAASGECEPCPDGHYNDQPGAAFCKPCPAGYSCSSGIRSACGGGRYSSQPVQTMCADCPANTFSPRVADGTDDGVTHCTPCPKGTIAPEASSACGIPWDTAFHA